MKQADTIHATSDISAIFSLFSYGKGNLLKLFGSICVILIGSICILASANLMGQLAEKLGDGAQSSSLYTITTAIIALELCHLILIYLGRVSLANVTNQVALGVRKALFRKTSRLPISYFDSQPLGRTLTRLTSDVEGIETFFTNTLPRLISAAITIFIVFVAMIVTDVELGLVIVLSSLPALIFTIAMRAPVRHWLREYKKRSAGLNATLAEYLNGLSVIKAFGLESWTFQRFTDESRSLLSSALKLMTWNSAIRPFAALLCFIPMLVVLWWGGSQVLNGSISLGLLVAFIRYTERFYKPIMMISFELHLIQDAITSSDRVKRMLDEPDEDKVFSHNGKRSAQIVGDIKFKNVSMSYDDNKQVLKDISFHIRAGETVALVGRTGSGKTSTVQLIPQLYPFQSGEICIDDIALHQWQPQQFRSQLGMVTQDVPIFHGTVRDNLLAALPEGRSMSDHELLTACSQTKLDSIIEAMPSGLDTVLHDNGSNLSLGEKQMIAFTRMIIRDPQILILDEATANIDQGYEELLQDTLQANLGHKTCIIVAHRLNTIKSCDKILVFDQGRIIEQGDHDSLIKKNGYYANLVERQIHGT
ncbi:MAG: ABC transporter ATP-binding protein [Pseudobacteriovorax sp.]|nr:ABC transporter ATP-binding protein [Pseudobacteriovorax sp.]